MHSRHPITNKLEQMREEVVGGELPAALGNDPKIRRKITADVLAAFQ